MACDNIPSADISCRCRWWFHVCSTVWQGILR